jgi:hydroxyethylthiazole kinase-like uncharacterized protein yjeF
MDIMNNNDSALYFSETLRHVESRFAGHGLMLQAGAAAFAWAEELLKDASAAVLVLAGPGNNGGDALEMARLLRKRRFTVHVVFIGKAEHLPLDAARVYRQFVTEGGQTLDAIPHAMNWGLIVDGLFGIGLARPLEGDCAQLVKAANILARSLNCPLLALDCPSGLNADTGFGADPTIHATHTLTFIGAKPGLYTADGPDHCGQIRVHDLGLTREEPSLANAADGKRITRAGFAHCLLPRCRNSHKGNYGTIGIIGGAHSMIGAALLAGRSALKLGAGRVILGLLDAKAPCVDFEQPELMLRKPEGVFEAGLDVLVCGPGLGRSMYATELLERALDAPIPLILDADALNILAFEEAMQATLQLRAAPTLLTPHPAEAARLLDLQANDIQQDRIRMAQELAHRYRAWIALKGCGSVIANHEGQWHINTTGNPGLSSAGSGDVLTGLVAALIGQNWPPGEALLAACHLHGQAADDLVASGIGPVGLCAGELADAARNCFNRWLNTPR